MATLTLSQRFGRFNTRAISTVWSVTVSAARFAVLVPGRSMQAMKRSLSPFPCRTVNCTRCSGIPCVR
jgi:hypothetical protein